jgi:hypothetical protein
MQLLDISGVKRKFRRQRDNKKKNSYFLVDKISIFSVEGISPQVFSISESCVSVSLICEQIP